MVTQSGARLRCGLVFVLALLTFGISDLPIRASQSIQTHSSDQSHANLVYWLPTQTTAAPSARGVHTAVWTGMHMIVWGGSDGMHFLNTGARYSPANDDWLPMSAVNAPDGRGGHSAVWTGSEMIIWAGSTGLLPSSTYFDTGARYNPVTDSWTPLSQPSDIILWQRLYHTAVWTGSEMLVWGGYGPVGNNFWDTLGFGLRYNPNQDAWVAIKGSGQPDFRQRHSAVWTGHEMIIWGGNRGTAYNTGGRYTPATDSWTATSTTNAPSARSSHTAVWTGREMVVWGGNNQDANQHLVYWGDGGAYNPTTNSWSMLPALAAPSVRAGHTAVWTGSQMIVWGGFNGSSPFLNTGARLLFVPPPTWQARALPFVTRR